MTDDPKAGAPAPDDAKTERDAASSAPLPQASGDSPKPHGDKLEKAVDEAARPSGGAKD